MGTWINFKKLRENISFEQVLRLYGVDIKLKGKTQHQGFCPLPKHAGERKRSPSFSANLEKGIFQCFSCGAKGNVIDFAALMENLDPSNGDDFRKAALLLQEKLRPASAEPKLKPKKPEPESNSEEKKPVVANAPLDFALKDLDSAHPYLKERGLNENTIEKFGLGHCSRGYFKDRIVIPLHSAGGSLIGYAGRVTDDSKISETCPKYLFPGSRERDGRILDFRKSEFLYNGYRFKAPVDDLVVVEGFFSVHWLYQCGIESVVGLMGWACSEEQGDSIITLTKPGGRVWIFSDGDGPGEKCAASVFHLVAPHRSVRWARLTEGRQPTDCPKEELTKTLFR
jgi:DNA primase